MERRQNTRYSGAGFVYVSAGRHRLKRLRILNLSARGVFVETTSLSLPLDTPVQLVFVVDTNRVARVYHRHAMVAHASRNGIGMLLHRTAHATRRAGAIAST